MQYTLVANSVDPDQVEERTINGDRHLVAKDVTFIRPMRLANGYVPKQSVANSAPAWDRSPLTINHPKNLPDRPWYDPDNRSFFVSANQSEEVRRRKVVGHAEDPSLRDDGSVTADLAVNVDRLEAIADGEAVGREDADAAPKLQERLENGEPFDVSSQYFPQPLPPGEYDGEHRDQVEAIANADSIALLPTKDGVCSLEDGCGFKPPQATANTDVVRAPVANADSSDGPTGASSSGRDATDDTLTDVDPADVDEWADGEWDDGEPSENMLLDLGRRAAAAIGLTDGSTETMPAESGVDDVGGSPTANGSAPGDDPGTTMERDKLIDEITSNSEIESESLEGMGDTCLESTHEHVVGNEADEEEEEQEETTNDGGETLADMTVDELGDALADQGFVTEGDVGEAVANAQQRSEKEQRVDRIVANSSEYDSDDKETLLDTPEGVLEDIEVGLSSNGTLPGATGAADRATANAAGGDDDADDYPDGTIGGGA